MGRTDLLFSYGTLQDEKVQISTYKRTLNGKKDSLSGYRLSVIKITNPEVVRLSGKKEHPALVFTGDKADLVFGMVFELDHVELLLTDKYEGHDYLREEVTLDSGKKAWIYVPKGEVDA
ncbi:gamma-glutamylcyclotransferase family protein [Fangia hongkongensis]|uniref:gamma-glutamylcyclotransferase family protein n=2 Tax=Fangia hongkongensis TaxID=270495 RepID=UPI00037FC744|nr:gamma-glutamylcyclotransferase family protein [Fangia hongkongensis]